jgi:hypothetical protein
MFTGPRAGPFGPLQPSRHNCSGRIQRALLWYVPQVSIRGHPPRTCVFGVPGGRRGRACSPVRRGVPVFAQRGPADELPGMQRHRESTGLVLQQWAAAMPSVRRGKLAVPWWCAGGLGRYSAEATWPRPRTGMIRSPRALSSGVQADASINGHPARAGGCGVGNRRSLQPWHPPGAHQTSSRMFTRAGVRR